METVLERPPEALSPAALPLAGPTENAGLAIQYSDRELTALTIAKSLISRRPAWTAFFREIFGVDGAVRRLCKTPEELGDFEQTRGYAELQAMLDQLRESELLKDPMETTRVITVRLPKSMHASLIAEAHDRGTSMNQLCITKLLQVLEADLVTR